MVSVGFLRQRKAMLHNGSILPQYAASPLSPSFPRRRRRANAKLGVPLLLVTLILLAVTWRWSNATSRQQEQRKLPFVSSDQRKTITCSDGSVGWLDDDYCDCHDGSDEPNTSACSYLRVQHVTFSCADGSKQIFSSRVGDGVQDCDYGSDEQNRRGSIRIS